MLPAAWQSALDTDHLELLAKLEGRLEKEANGGEIFPPKNLRYRALELVSPETVKVVLIGQDPYHGPSQAMGLSFSVPEGVTVPPSLRNIFKELRSDLGAEIPSHGDLTAWAEEGVLLLNTSLSVLRGKPGSHADYGWREITGRLLAHISRTAPPTVFLLWGKHAQSRIEAIDAERHLVLKCGHPSPYAAHLFFGNSHFSQANAFLRKHGRGAVRWALDTRNPQGSLELRRDKA
jgi:uracil-DNA glycosylase